MSQIQSALRPNCSVLAVLCGKFADKQQAPTRLAPDAKRVRLSYPFPELISSGRLEVSSFRCMVWIHAYFEFYVKGALGDAGAHSNQSHSRAI